MIDPEFGVITDFQAWLNRVLEQKPVPEIRLALDGKEFILKNVTADIEPGDSEGVDIVSLSFDVPRNTPRDPLENFKIVDPNHLSHDPTKTPGTKFIDYTGEMDDGY